MKWAKTPFKTLTSFTNWSPWSKLNLKSKMYTDMLIRMPYNRKKNSKTMIDVIKTPKTLT